MKTAIRDNEFKVEIVYELDDRIYITNPDGSRWWVDKKRLKYTNE